MSDISLSTDRHEDRDRIGIMFNKEQTATVMNSLTSTIETLKEAKKLLVIPYNSILIDKEIVKIKAVLDQFQSAINSSIATRGMRW